MWYSYFCLYLQEEIKILKVSLFVNPYTEPDEEEEKAKEEEETKRDDDYVMLLHMLFQLQSWTFCVYLSPMVLTFICINSG